VAESVPESHILHRVLFLVQGWAEGTSVEELLAPGWVGSLEIEVIKLLLVGHCRVIL